MRNRKPNPALTVQAKDTYDERDYTLVHNKYLAGMREAIRQAHKRVTGTDCICIYCGRGEDRKL